MFDSMDFNAVATQGSPAQPPARLHHIGYIRFDDRRIGQVRADKTYTRIRRGRKQAYPDFLSGMKAHAGVFRRDRGRGEQAGLWRRSRQRACQDAAPVHPGAGDPVNWSAFSNIEAALYAGRIQAAACHSPCT